MPTELGETITARTLDQMYERIGPLLHDKALVDVVVEEVQHCRRFERRLQHLPEIAQHVLADDVAVEE